MAHASQERYSALVDAKLRATLVTRDNTIFNNRYEGSPKAGIDAATFGRAESHAAGCEACREALADACGQIVGLLAAASAAGAVPGAASVSNDGYSVTFGSNASVTAATRQEAYEIIRTALGSDPHGLLYRGIL